MYADLVRLEEDVDRLLQSGSELGANLLAQKESLERLGVRATIRLRHGLVLPQIFAEIRESNHDLIVVGTARSRGPFGHYMMGDVTRRIVNRAPISVLVARATKTDEIFHPGIWNALRKLFRSQAAAI